MLVLDKSIIIQETLHSFLCRLKGGFCIKPFPIISIVVVVRYHKSSLLTRFSLLVSGEKRALIEMSFYQLSLDILC